MNNIIKYSILTLCIVSLGYLLPLPVLIKLMVVLFLAVSLKLVFFQYVDFYHIYKKAKETATGAGMVFLALSLVISALIISGV